MYYKRTYTFKARREGWKDHPLDIGLNELVPNTLDPAKPPQLKAIVTGASTRVSKPYPLDGAGRKRATPTEAPAVLEFLPYKVRSWASLEFSNPAIWATT